MQYASSQNHHPTPNRLHSVRPDPLARAVSMVELSQDAMIFGEARSDCGRLNTGRQTLRALTGWRPGNLRRRIQARNTTRPRRRNNRSPDFRDSERPRRSSTARPQRAATTTVRPGNLSLGTPCRAPHTPNQSTPPRIGSFAAGYRERRFLMRGSARALDAEELASGVSGRGVGGVQSLRARGRRVTSLSRHHTPSLPRAFGSAPAFNRSFTAPAGRGRSS